MSNKSFSGQLHDRGGLSGDLHSHLGAFLRWDSSATKLAGHNDDYDR